MDPFESIEGIVIVVDLCLGIEQFINGYSGFIRSSLLLTGVTYPDTIQA